MALSLRETSFYSTVTIEEQGKVLQRRKEDRESEKGGVR
jgi:hypothetical protein